MPVHYVEQLLARFVQKCTVRNDKANNFNLIILRLAEPTSATWNLVPTRKAR